MDKQFQIKYIIARSCYDVLNLDFGKREDSMNKIRQSFYLCREQFRYEIHSPRVIVAYILGMVDILAYCFKYLQYSGPNPVQIFEPFILYFNSRGHITYALLGVFLIFSDAPFVTARSTTLIYRTTRKSWGAGMCTYIMLQVASYYAFMLIVSAGSVALSSFTGNLWSKPIYTMASYDPIAMDKYGLELPEISLLQNYTPVTAVIHSFCLVALYSIVLGTLLFVLNLNCSKVIGSVITFLIHLTGYVITSDTIFGIPLRASFLGNAILQWHTAEYDSHMSLFYSYIFFLIVIIILLNILEFIAKRTDYKVSVSGK